MPKKARTDSGEEDWKKKLAVYDDECNDRDRVFRSHHIVINEDTHERLTEEENVVLSHMLNGVTCDDMAKEIGIETEDIIGLVEVIRTKLIIED